jgi:hypothetical protein
LRVAGTGSRRQRSDIKDGGSKCSCYPEIRNAERYRKRRDGASMEEKVLVLSGARGADRHARAEFFDNPGLKELEETEFSRQV